MNTREQRAQMWHSLRSDELTRSGWPHIDPRVNIAAGYYPMVGHTFVNEAIRSSVHYLLGQRPASCFHTTRGDPCNCS